MIAEEDFQLINDHDCQTYKNFFEEKKQGNKISFADFMSVLKTNPMFDQAKLQEKFDALQKQIKANQSSESDQGIMLSENDYYKYVKKIIIDHHRMNNEKDVEFRKLFDLLAGKDDTVTKKQIISILDTFGIKINYQQFFSAIGDKNELEFSDFCCLFKFSGEKDIFRKTFTEAFKEKNEDDDVRKYETSYTFPIIPCK